MRRTLGQIRAILVDGTAPAAEMLTRRVKAGVYLARLAMRIVKQWARDRCPQIAGALAFLGIGTRLAALSVLVTQTMAIAKVHRSKGFDNLKGGYEFNLSLIAAAIGQHLGEPVSL